MNRSTYRLVWSRILQGLVAVAETARGHGKGRAAATRVGRRVRRSAASMRSMLLVPLAVAASAAWAIDPGTLPSGAQVVAGQAVVGSATGNSAGSASLIVNQGSARAVINWNSYSIGSQASVTYVQPGSSAVVLNRVTGGEPSQILGRIEANGQVFLVNGHGVLFGRGAQVDVRGLLASTLDIGTDDFMAGRLQFAAAAGSAGSDGRVSNAGRITAGDGGYVVLLGGQVENSGQISARLGSVVLASGSRAALDFRGDGLLQVAITEGTAQALADNSGTLQTDGGRVQLSARAADDLISAVVNNGGRLQAQTLVERDGVIELSGGVVSQTGALDVSGARGGSVRLDGRSVLQAGTIAADGQSGNGGQVTLAATQTLLQTEAGRISADGVTSGGQVTLGAGDSAYLSGRVQAGGEQGGAVAISAAQLVLAAADVSADGRRQGGSVLIGGDVQGSRTGLAGLQPAGSTAVNATTRLSAAGAGGKVVVWADGDTHYDGQARAGSSGSSGAGGFIEISGKGTLHLGGTADAGQGGQVLIDPTDILIAASGATTYIPLADPTPNAADQHGSGGVTELTGGNLVVASPNDSFGAAQAGAVYLYHGTTGALISALYGSTANDRVGDGGVTALSNGHFVVSSPYWNNGAVLLAGAATWGSGQTGVSGSVSRSNSLVGSTANDQVGGGQFGSGYGGVTALSNGHYVVNSALWNGQINGVTIGNVGAVTWGDGTRGITGEVSASNSLVGSTAGDRVGSGGVTALSNGHYVVSSPSWTRPVIGAAAISSAGAVTWGNGGGGLIGAVSDSNSLVGGTANDRVGSGGVMALANGNYVVSSPNWDLPIQTASLADLGAVTWGNGKSGTTGVVGRSNSITGSTSGDQVGGHVTALTNGNYVISSLSWDNVAAKATSAGAVTWADGTQATAAVVSSANSLVGSTTNDWVGGFGGVTALANGHYVVASPYWNNGSATSAGAVTWGNGLGGTIGAVSAGNSLVGSSNSDLVGSSITALTNGHYVVASPNWSNGQQASAGAVTWADGTKGLSGAVTTANSLTGSSANDRIGSGGVTALTNGNYVVSSPRWNNGGLAQAGAVTWASGTTGRIGVVSAANSVVGSHAGDQVGASGFSDSEASVSGGEGVHALSDGNYLIDSVNWSDGTATGAVTWGDGARGSSGVIAASNSALGRVVLWPTSGKALSNGHFLVGTQDAQGAATAVWLGITAVPDYTPTQLAGLAPQGTTLTLQADRDITINSPVTVGGTLVLNAGNRLTLNAALTSTEGGTSSNPQVAATTAVGDPVLVLSAGSSFVNNAGATALNTPNGSWQVWSADPATSTLGGLVYDFKQYNATYGGTTALGIGNGLFYRLAPTLTPSLSGTALKTYDGTTQASLAGLQLTATGAIDGDSVTLGATSASYATRNAGTGLDVTATGLQVTASQGTAAVYGYQVPASVTAAAAGTIDRAALGVTGTTAASKVYDGTTTAQVGGGQLVGVIGEDSVTLSQSGTFADSSAGASKTVTVTNQLGGADAGNYSVGPTEVRAGIVDDSLKPQPASSTATDTPTASGRVGSSKVLIVPALIRVTPSEVAVVEAKPVFEPLAVTDLSQDTLRGLLAYRDHYKRTVFAEALEQLEQNPALADLRPCRSLEEVDEGICLITDELRQKIRETGGLPAVAASPPAPAQGAAGAPAASGAPVTPPARTAPVPVARAESADLPRLRQKRVRTAALPQIRRKIALVVGVNRYADPVIPTLVNAVGDARSVADTLGGKLGYETVLLENASRAAVVRELNRLAVEAGPHDSVVIYYAGHGAVVESSGAGYWQLADGQSRDPKTWLSNADIARLIGQVGASQVALISDSCYSGTLLNGERIQARAGKVDADALLARKAVVVMSSGGNEPVFDEGKDGHSLFAWHLMRTLGQVSGWQPGGNVFERVRFGVARELPQRPQYGASSVAGHQSGSDYLFEQRQVEDAGN